MNRIERLKPNVGYDEDFALWSAQQAELIRAGRFDGIDLENVAEEIESLGRSDKREIDNRVRVILVHLLKWEYQPKKRKPGWLSTLVEQRRHVAALIEESPSLSNRPRIASQSEYSSARRKAVGETKLPIMTFPKDCPYGIDDIMSDDFYPGEPWVHADLYKES